MKNWWDQLSTGLNDLLMTITDWFSIALVVGAFLWLLSDLTLHGIAKLNWSFLVSAPENAGRDGGIGTILVSTLLILGVALLATIPLGLGTAV